MGDNRGWLNNGATIGAHPKGVFGPLGMHGKTGMEVEGGSGIEVKVVEVGEHADSKSYPDYVPGQAETAANKPTHYDAGRLYKITLSCPKACSFLMTVEHGDVAESGLKQQVGEFDEEKIAADHTVQRFRGIDRYIAATNTNNKKNAYDLYWKAPGFTDPIRYADLFVRVTAVIDEDNVCPGKYYEYRMPSLVQCGDGWKEEKEFCDDGNTSGGDGCSETCEIELGWTCADLVDAPLELQTYGLPNAGKKMSRCTKAEVVLTPGEVTVEEGGQVGYVVSLSTFVEPGKEVYLTIVPPGTYEVNFPVRSSFYWDQFNWDMSYSVVVDTDYGTLESTVNGDRTYTVAHNVDSTDKNFQNLVVNNLLVHIKDDDVAGIYTSQPSELLATESGKYAEYTVGLTAAPVPGSLVIVDLEPYNGDGSRSQEVFLNPPSLVFGNGDWNITQRVTVQPRDNDIVDGVHNVTVYHNVKSQDPAFGGLDTSGANITIMIEDNDAAGLLIQPTTLGVVENGPEVNYTVTLRAAMADNTTVTVVLEPECASPLGNPCELSAIGPDGKPELVFTELNFRESQTVRVKARDNVFRDSTRTGKVAHKIVSEDPSYSDLPVDIFPYEVTVTVEDDDSFGVQAPDRMEIYEGGGAEPFSFVLKSKPFAPVTLNLELRDTGFLKLCPFSQGALGMCTADQSRATIVVQPEMWRSPEEIVLETTFMEDIIDSGDRETAIKVTTQSADPAYHDLVIPDIVVHLYDNDVAGVFVDLRKFYGQVISVTEGKDSVQVPVSLTTRPMGPSEVVLDIKAGAQVAITPTKLTFDYRTFDKPQTINIVAVDDAVIEDETHLDQMVITVSSPDAQYQALGNLNYRIDIVENDRGKQEVVVNHLGGIVSPTSPVGAAILTVPPGVVSTEGLEVAVTEQAKPPPPGTSRPAPDTKDDAVKRLSGVYAFTPHGATFVRPVFLSVEYDEEAMQKLGPGMELAWFRKATPSALYYEKLDGGVFEKGVASLATTSFSDYYIGASPKTVAPPESALTADNMAKCLNGYSLSVGSDGQPTFKYGLTIPSPPPQPTEIVVTKTELWTDEFLIVVVLLGVENVLFLAVFAWLWSKARQPKVEPGVRMKELVVVGEKETDGGVLGRITEAIGGEALIKSPPDQPSTSGV